MCFCLLSSLGACQMDLLRDLLEASAPQNTECIRHYNRSLH